MRVCTPLRALDVGHRLRPFARGASGNKPEPSEVVFGVIGLGPFVGVCIQCFEDGPCFEEACRTFGTLKLLQCAEKASSFRGSLILLAIEPMNPIVEGQDSTVTSEGSDKQRTPENSVFLCYHRAVDGHAASKVRRLELEADRVVGESLF